MRTPTTFRKARTRTLIQLGGLVEKSGLLDLLDLPLGADLQRDGEVQRGAAVLLGALLQVAKDLRAEPCTQTLFFERGMSAMEKSRGPAKPAEGDVGTGTRFRD